MRVAACAAVGLALVSSGAPGGASASVSALCKVPNYTGGMLAGVAATSGGNAWAVGTCTGTASRQTLIERWNGTTWNRVSSPDPSGLSGMDSLSGVAAVSSSQAWAVGQAVTSGKSHTLVLHWNGMSWKRVPSPTPKAGGYLVGVSATSKTNAWAVGQGSGGLILHWNGTSWARVPTPTGSDILSGVAALSASNAWVVGSYDAGAGWRTLILRWNGSAWKQVPSPNPDASIARLYGVAAVSSSDAWAVGWDSGNGQTLIEHWNGRTWTLVPSPNPAPAGYRASLASVAAISVNSAWAVGSYMNGSSSDQCQTFILRWNGATWKRVPSPNPWGTSACTDLSGAAIVSSSNAWAVGQHYDGMHRTLVLHWNGISWKRSPSP